MHKLRGKTLSEKYQKEIEDTLKIWDRIQPEQKRREEFEWVLGQINKLTDKQYTALQNYYKREFNNKTWTFVQELLYNTDSFYHWLKAVTGSSLKDVEEIIKSFQIENNYKLDEQSKKDLGIKEPQATGYHQDMAYGSNNKILMMSSPDMKGLLKQIDEKIEKHIGKNEGAYQGWVRMKNYITTGVGDEKLLLKEAERKRHNNPKLWDKVIKVLKKGLDQNIYSVDTVTGATTKGATINSKTGKRHIRIVKVPPKPETYKEEFDKVWKREKLKSFKSDNIQWFQWTKYKLMPWYNPKIRLVNMGGSPIIINGYISPKSKVEFYTYDNYNELTHINMKVKNHPLPFIFNRDWQILEGKLMYRALSGNFEIMPNPLVAPWREPTGKLIYKTLTKGNLAWYWRIDWRGERDNKYIQIQYTDTGEHTKSGKTYKFEDWLSNIDKANKEGKVWHDGFKDTV